MIGQNKKVEWKKLSFRKKLVVVSISLCLLVTPFAVGEVACRLFVDINFRGNSKNLFVANAFGISRGNAKQITGVSFGAEVVTDELGFRISKGSIRKISAEAVLFLGDSVAFGTGVSEEETFVGRFSKAVPNIEVYNSSVIGYALPDYKHVVEGFVPQHNEIKHVYLMFCLNDLSDESGEIINRFVSGSSKGFIETAKKVRPVSMANEFLRDRSKLYLFLTEKLTDPSRRYFEADFAPYASLGDEAFGQVMQPVLSIVGMLKRRQIRLTVVVLPYEMQLRGNDQRHALPQNRLKLFFEKHGVRSIDLIDAFHRLSSTKDGFLFGDPMHLSRIGHSAVFDALWRDWLERTH